MDDAGLTPLLIDATKEYVGQLTDILAPYVVNHLVGLYMAAQKQAPKAHTLTFQNALRAIPQWNSNTVQQHTADIQNKYSFLGDLIAACFVAYVKILSSVKLHQQKPNIRLKLPTNDAFVHKVYIHTAREFYATPALLRADRAVKVGIIRAAVEASVRDMLPIEDILKAYLGNTVDSEENIVPSEFLDDDMYEAKPAATDEDRQDSQGRQDSQDRQDRQDRHSPSQQPPAEDPPAPDFQFPPENIYEAEDEEDVVKHVSLGGPPQPQAGQAPPPFGSQAPPPPTGRHFGSQAPAPPSSHLGSQAPQHRPRPLFSDANDEAYE